MATVVRTKLVPVEPAAVWRVLADFAAISAWAPNVDHSCLLSEQHVGAGATRRVQVGRATLVETVTTWTPDRTLAYTISGLPPVIRSVTNTWQLERAGDGTMVSLTSEVDTGNRPPRRAIAKPVGRKLGSASDEMLAGLAAHLDEMEVAR